MKHAYIRIAGRYFTILSLGTFLLYAPALAQEAPRVAHQITDGRHTLHMETQTDKIQIEQDGEIEIGPDDRSITGISEGGFFKIKKSTFGNTRELLVKNTGGTLQYEYKEGGRTVPFEPAGRAWLADILPDLVRGTTIGAESRVDRFYQKGGVKAVLQEMSNMKSDHAKARYASLLLKKNLKESELPSVIEGIGRQIKSDFYRYEVFKNNSELLLANPQRIGNYLNAINTVESDHYKSELVKLALSQNLPQQFGTQALQLISTIESDHYQSEVIKRLANTNKLSEEQLAFLLSKLLTEVNSDHFRSEIISAVLSSQHKLSSGSINAVISAIQQTESDRHAAESLKRLVKTQQLNATNYEALFRTLHTLESDHHKAEFMGMLVQEGNLTNNFEMFLQQTQQIKSSHHRANVLERAAAHANLNDEQKAALVKSTASIESDHYKTEVLMKMCQSSNSSKVKEAIKEAAKTIRSEHYYGKTMRCVQ